MKQYTNQTTEKEKKETKKEKSKKSEVSKKDYGLTENAKIIME